MAFFDYTGFATCDGVYLGDLFDKTDHHGTGNAHFVLGLLTDTVQIVGKKCFAELYVRGVEVDLDDYEITRADFNDHDIWSDAETGYVGVIDGCAFTIERWDDRVEARLVMPNGSHWHGEARYGD